MKRMIILAMAMAILLFTGQAFAVGPINLMTNNVVAKGGASVFVVDLTKLGMDEVQSLSAQYSGVTSANVYYSGATQPVIKWGTSDHLPIGMSIESVQTAAFTSTLIGEGIEWTPVMPNNIGYTSGASRTPWPFVVEPAKYLLVKVDNSEGVTNFRVSADLVMSNQHNYEPPTTWLATLTFGPLGVAGTSVFSSGDSYGVYVPDGARYALIKSADSGNSLWITRRSAVDYTKDPALQAGDIMPVFGKKAELERIGVGAAVSGVKAIVEFYTRKPF
jgi:hypothetical protein